MSRELTREEKAAIRALVVKWCANYDREYGCLPLDCECYMLGKCWTGAYCRYFREAVLPLNPALEAALSAQGPAPETRPCAPGTEAGLYAETAGLVSGKLGPLKPACIKALPGLFRGGAYHFTSCPCFRLIHSTFYSLRGGYYGRKSKLYNLKGRHAGKWLGRQVAWPERSASGMCRSMYGCGLMSWRPSGSAWKRRASAI